MRLRWVLAAALTSALAGEAFGASPTVTELVESLGKHHPEYLASRSRTEQVAGEQAQADAQFDLRLIQETYVRPSGYYDGRYAEQGIVQPLGPLNAQLFGTYRISEGTFPVYQADYETLDQGEASVGIKFSLLQNRDTDSRRLALTTAAFKYLEAESKQNVELNKLIFQGVSTWLEWYQSHQKLEIVKNLVRLTSNRLQGIEARVQSGDLAEITLTEFKTTLLQRQLLQQEAEQRVVLAKQRLAYFWRPNEGSFFAGNDIDSPPEDIRWPYRVASLSQGDFSDSIAGHPALVALNAKTDQARNRQRLARNETLPKLDLEMKLAQDMGDGAESLTGTESVVGLSFYMPLGQRAAKAREAVASAQIRELEYESRVLAEQLERDVSVSLKALAFSRQILSLSEQQKTLAGALLSQEQTRFEAGVSDQFLLITRETAALQAQLKWVDAKIEALRNELSLHATLAKLALPG